jgi:hypothetical protein
MSFAIFASWRRLNASQGGDSSAGRPDPLAAGEGRLSGFLLLNLVVKVEAFIRRDVPLSMAA